MKNRGGKTDPTHRSKPSVFCKFKRRIEQNLRQKKNRIKGNEHAGEFAQEIDEVANVLSPPEVGEFLRVHIINSKS